MPTTGGSAINAVRDVILTNLDSGYEESIGYGMIAYCVPHSAYPAGYHCNPKQALPFAMLGSEKNYMSLHMMPLYSGGEPGGAAGQLQDWFRAEWAKTGKKLDMGKACIRFKNADDLALDVIAKVIRKVPARKWIAQNEKFLESRMSSKRASTAPKRKSPK